MVCLRCLYQRTLVLNRQFVTNIYLPNRADKQIEKPFWALPYLKQFHLIQFQPIKRFDSSTYEDFSAAKVFSYQWLPPFA